MKKILAIVPYRYLPYESGGQKLIANFLQYLGEKSELHVIGTKKNDSSLVKSYTFYGLLNGSQVRYINFLKLFNIKKLIQSKRIETIIIEHPYLGWMGIILKLFTNTKLIIHTHNIEYERFRSIGKSWWWILKYYEKWVLKNADLIFCISDDDRNWMNYKIGIKKEKTITIPYGINQNKYPEDKHLCKEKVCKIHNLESTSTLLFFNGVLDYAPNTDALNNILYEINPLLLNENLSYTILVAGKNLPNAYNNLKEWNNKNIYYVGYVEDIECYTKAADIFLNPVNTGGGIKTKMIEALGMGATVVATENGALGVDVSVCGNKLKIVGNNDWAFFAKEIKKNIISNEITPHLFYTTYNWNEIINKAVNYI